MNDSEIIETEKTHIQETSKMQAKEDALIKKMDKTVNQLDGLLNILWALLILYWTFVVLNKIVKALTFSKNEKD